MTSPRFRSSSAFDAVFCDVDGCLIDEAGGPLPLEKLGRVATHNRLALEQKDRPVVTLCTGRPEGFAECLARVIHNTLIPIVCENGAWLHDPVDNAWLLDPAVNAGDAAAVAALERWVAEELTSEGFTFQPGKAASVSLYHPDPTRLDALQPRLRAAAAAHGWPFRVSATRNYINCDLEKVSKATGIARCLALTGIDSARCAGIGDTAHDLQIAESVAWFGVPANRHAVLDDAADVVAEAHSIDGVLELLGRLP